MSPQKDRPKPQFRNRCDPLKWMSEQERAEAVAKRLTLAQQQAIAADTRLPGEIACTYKTARSRDF
jgi:hypothetical protein